MFNHVGLLGRLAQEPEIRYTTGGTPVARFDLAVPVPSNYEGGGTNGNAQQTDAGDGFMSIPDGVDDELPFN